MRDNVRSTASSCAARRRGWVAAVVLGLGLIIAGCQVVWIDPETGEVVSGSSSGDSGGRTPLTGDDAPFFLAPKDAELTFPVEMVTVPKGGVGPQYTFEIGKYEIKIRQFVEFLNAADLDGGATEIGANMWFDDNGGVYMRPDHGNSEEFLLCPTEPLDRSSNVQFRPEAPRGQRFGGRAELWDIPVTEVSWYGALKFCNWLTIREGLGLDQRCYAEGPNPEDWRPVVIPADEWQTRDLNDAEKTDLVLNYRGYRLPMDNVGPTNGSISAPENPFNEYYKAAAFDPNGPQTSRIGPGGETVSPLHWIYAVGRDEIDGTDANFFISGDIPETDALHFTSQTPGGYFNGVNALSDGQLTNDTNNTWGIYDMAGNVAEWLQDKSGSTGILRPVIGGTYIASVDQLAAASRKGQRPNENHTWLGFRVMRAPRNPILPE